MSTSDITLTCKPSRVENALQFNYTVTNGSSEDIYVLDSFPIVDPATQAAKIDPNGAYVGLIAKYRVWISRGIPPLPRRSVVVRIIPLGTKIAAGAKVDRNFTLPLPLAEQSPYYGDLPLRDYEQQDVNEVVLSVQVLRASKSGFVAMPVDFTEEARRVQTQATVQDAETLTCEFPTKSLVILKRQDDFVRIAPKF